jgi:hypothetical protein
MHACRSSRPRRTSTSLSTSICGLLKPGNGWGVPDFHLARRVRVCRSKGFHDGFDGKHLSPFRRVYEFYCVRRLSLPRPVREERRCSTGRGLGRFLRDRSCSVQPVGRSAEKAGRTTPSDVLYPNRQCLSRKAAEPHTRTFEKGDSAAHSFIERTPHWRFDPAVVGFVDPVLRRIPAVPRIETPFQPPAALATRKTGKPR